MTTGVIICGIRSLNPRYSIALAELAVEYKGRGVLAFDLAGQEKDYPAKAHRAAFRLILKNNINSTVHAGEAFGPASIAQALHYCGAHRIGHGTRLREDPDLMRYVNDHRIPLEVCLSSNVQTRAVPSIKRASRSTSTSSQGLRVTLNTDSRLISATTVSKELALAARTFRLSPYEVKRIIINGLQERVPALRAEGARAARGQPRDRPDLHGGVSRGVRPARHERTDERRFGPVAACRSRRSRRSRRRAGWRLTARTTRGSRR